MNAPANGFTLPPPGGCPGPLSLRSALGAWLAGKAEEDCLLLFGVGAQTLDRVVEGSVIPDDDLAERIWAQVRP